MTIKDDFALLGLELGAVPEEIVSRYKQRAMVVHPDVVGTGNAAKFSALNSAYHRALDYAYAEPCVICNGTKKIKHSSGFHTVEMPCTSCGQTGKKFRKK